MRRLILAAAMSGAALTAGYGVASAQVAIEVPGAGVYIGPDNYYYNDDHYDYSDRGVYSYYYYDRDYRARKRERRTDRALCGRRAYWDGSACQPGRRP